MEITINIQMGQRTGKLHILILNFSDDKMLFLLGIIINL